MRLEKCYQMLQNVTFFEEYHLVTLAMVTPAPSPLGGPSIRTGIASPRSYRARPRRATSYSSGASPESPPRRTDEPAPGCADPNRLW